ncbi:MAG: NAD(P)-dependent alcohol dehydrogenase [Deltaproteobacteria bacterium]|nr:NAD(P)-dependent alcohol dehydrogenase [Deltaproteobacteria bacterium]
MQAYVFDNYGGPETMHLGSLPDPVPGKGEVVVRVRASSVNPVDWKIRSGMMRLISGRKFPRALGTEFAGDVAALGPGVVGWSVGDPVYGMSVTALGRNGSHAELVAVSAKALRRKPDFLSYEQAATVPVAALTALHGLRLAGDVNGKAVLVNGATGGVGHFALQIAKFRGATVTAVCSAKNAHHAQALGADRVLDYRAVDFADAPERYDVVYDAFGAKGFASARRALTPDGVYVTPLGMPAVILRSLWQNLVGRQKLLIGNVRTEQQDYAEIEAMLASGAVRPLIDRVVPLAQAGEAFAASEGGGLAGKVVITV